jgi:hypothetical protein
MKAFLEFAETILQILMKLSVLLIAFFVALIGAITWRR